MLLAASLLCQGAEERLERQPRTVGPAHVHCRLPNMSCESRSHRMGAGVIRIARGTASTFFAESKLSAHIADVEYGQHDRNQHIAHRDCGSGRDDPHAGIPSGLVA